MKGKEGGGGGKYEVGFVGKGGGNWGRHLPLFGGEGSILRATFGLLRSEREQALLRLVPSAVALSGFCWSDGLRSSSAAKACHNHTEKNK